MHILEDGITISQGNPVGPAQAGDTIPIARTAAVTPTITVEDIKDFVAGNNVVQQDVLSGIDDVAINTTNIFFTGTSTANLPDPAGLSRKVTLRSLVGTGTITSDVGTVEQTTVTVGQSIDLVSRPTGWFLV